MPLKKPASWQPPAVNSRTTVPFCPRPLSRLSMRRHWSWALSVWWSAALIESLYSGLLPALSELHCNPRTFLANPPLSFLPSKLSAKRASCWSRIPLYLIFHKYVPHEILHFWCLFHKGPWPMWRTLHSLQEKSMLLEKGIEGCYPPFLLLHQTISFMGNRRVWFYIRLQTQGSTCT